MSDDSEPLPPDAPVNIEAVDPADDRARHCLRRYFADLDQRFDTGFDPAGSIPADLDDMRPPAGTFLLATIGSEPVGCGALKFHTGAATELKRMWVDPSARRVGLGRRLLVALEATARAAGSSTIHLETNHTLTEAIAMYRSAGYREVPAFNDETYADHWFEKDLAARPPG